MNSLKPSTRLLLAAARWNHAHYDYWVADGDEDGAKELRREKAKLLVRLRKRIGHGPTRKRQLDRLWQLMVL